MIVFLLKMECMGYTYQSELFQYGFSFLGEFFFISFDGRDYLREYAEGNGLVKMFSLKLSLKASPLGIFLEFLNGLVQFSGTEFQASSF